MQIVKTEFYSDKNLVHKIKIKYFRNKGFNCVVNENVKKIYWKSIVDSSEKSGIVINFPYEAWKIIGTIELIPLYFKSIITSINYFINIIYLGIYNYGKSNYYYKFL